jgi:hypothetical protein
MIINATEYKDIVVLLSGGADSAMMLHEMCDNSNLTELTIHCITGIGSSADPNQIIINDDNTLSLLPFNNKRGGVKKNNIAAKKIITYIRKKFPEVNITHDTFTYSSQECLNLLKTNSIEYSIEYFKSKGVLQYNVCPGKIVLDYKLVLVRYAIAQFVKKYKAYTVYNGKTANPPIDTMAELDMMDSRMVDRDSIDIKELSRDTASAIMPIQPFRLIDKSVLAEMYYKSNTMDMYLLTESCADPSLADGSNLPCKKCWWCKEKHWAFGTYDFGIV